MTWWKRPPTRRAAELSEDARAVVEAAWALKIGEFDLFRLAHRRWYGAEADEKDLEARFARYMFQQSVPPWVRQFCREVLSRRQAGTLDRRAFGADTVRRREPAETYRREFIAAAMVVMFLAYVFFVLLG
ncbi:MAG: hypothetical protein OEM59_14745 [Rhodospirillales bacterium]|nr:hypothetical protein [Rhodospirillales bacterium]